MNKHYSLQLEEKLISNFKKTFRDKLGYEPIVIANKDKNIPILGLTELKEYFNPHLPTKNEKIIPLDSNYRFREISDLRKMYCYIARLMHYNYTEIGESLGGIHHTSVLYCINKFKDLFKTNEAFKNKYFSILINIKNGTTTSEINSNTEQTQY